MTKTNNSLHTYLDEISREKLLSDEEERLLAQRIQEGDNAALDKLMTANLSYVVTLAHQYENRGLDLEDLISEGNIGLMQAATKFDGSKGKRFVTFAATYIREAMEQAIEQQSGLYRVPRNVNDSKLEKKRSRAISMDAPVGGSAELSLGRRLPDVNAVTPSEKLEDETLMNELRGLIYQLEDREQQVMRGLYALDGNTMTMQEIADHMGLKRERVRQIRNKALRRMAKINRNPHLKDYLKTISR